MQQTTANRTTDIGIASLGIALPELAVDVGEIARLRGVDPDKFRIGLGCDRMALCGLETGVDDLATKAARRALERWGGDPAEIGLLVVGTETALDMSRPLSAWVADQLGLRGAIRSYEVKHACYGGTLALRQAIEWRLSGAGRGPALVIAADVARYGPGDPGEPTGGAGAVAMVIDEADVAAVETRSYPYSSPAFDFWRPVGEAYPRVEGKLSLDCYNRAAAECFAALAADRGLNPGAFRAACFHVPFPKMVKKGVVAAGQRLGWEAAATQAFFADRVDPFMAWNRQMGNAYTASLWVAVAHALAGAREGERLLAFSYGSGFGAELLELAAGPAAAAGAWRADVEADLAARRELDADDYAALRAAEEGRRSAA